VRLLLLGSIVALVLLAGRAAYIGLVESGDLKARAADQAKRTVDLPASRGSIIASDGQSMALDKPTVAVSAVPRLIPDRHATAVALAPALGIAPAKIEDAFAKDPNYVPLAANVDLAAARRLQRKRLSGIDFADGEERLTPRGKVGAQVVGLTGDGGSGLTGLELQLNKSLTGTNGVRSEIRDPIGRPIRILAGHPPVPGKTVELTLDSTIQERTEDVLAQTLKQYGAKHAMAIVMNPQNGAILAMATVPRFNPNDRRHLDPELMRNRPITDEYEPGSTFKLVTISGALQEGLVTPQTSFYLPPHLQLYDRSFGEADRDFATTWSVADILSHSSNIGTIKIAMRLGKQRIQRWIERFGFGKPTGIDFPGEAPGTLQPTDQWYGTSIGSIPIGQTDTVTLMQLARAYAVPANGGRLVQPHLVARVGGRTVPHPLGKRVLTPAVAHEVSQMLRGVVSERGTGAAARVPGYEVAGKTGTAKKFDRKLGQYSDTRYTASFVGYVPAQKPRLLIAVAVDEPSTGAIFGGEVAAPAFEQIAEFCLLRLKIPPQP
jgi:cell division protein FtsI (penicillin-binding protein 3)